MTYENFTFLLQLIKDNNIPENNYGFIHRSDIKSFFGIPNEALCVVNQDSSFEKGCCLEGFYLYLPDKNKPCYDKLLSTLITEEETPLYDAYVEWGDNNTIYLFDVKQVNT